jgi:hypothetical protein
MEQFSLEDFLKQHPVVAKYMEDNPLMGDLSEDYPRAEVDAIQASMLEQASHFLDSELDDFTLCDKAYRGILP